MVLTLFDCARHELPRTIKGRFLWGRDKLGTNLKGRLRLADIRFIALDDSSTGSVYKAIGLHVATWDTGAKATEANI